MTIANEDPSRLTAEQQHRITSSIKQLQRVLALLDIARDTLVAGTPAIDTEMGAVDDIVEAKRRIQGQQRYLLSLLDAGPRAYVTSASGVGAGSLQNL